MFAARAKLKPEYGWQCMLTEPEEGRLSKACVQRSKNLHGIRATEHEEVRCHHRRRLRAARSDEFTQT